MNYTTFLTPHKTSRKHGEVELIERTVDFSLQSLDAGVPDTHQLINIEGGWLVLSASVNVITAAPTNATIDLGYGGIPSYWGSGLRIDTVGRVNTIFTATKTATMPDVVRNKEQFTTEVDVVGAMYGDHVSVSSQDDADIADVTFSGYVIKPGVVAINVINPTQGGLSLPTLTLEVVVKRAPYNGVLLVQSDTDTIDITATTDALDVDIDSGVIIVSALVVRV